MVTCGALAAQVFDTAMGVILEYMDAFDVGYFSCVFKLGGRVCRRYLESLAHGELMFGMGARLRFVDGHVDLDTEHCISINADERMLNHHGAEENAAYVLRRMQGDVQGTSIKNLL